LRHTPAIRYVRLTSKPAGRNASKPVKLIGF
jgi:hypothetical protein